MTPAAPPPTADELAQPRVPVSDIQLKVIGSRLGEWLAIVLRADQGDSADVDLYNAMATKWFGVVCQVLRDTKSSYDAEHAARLAAARELAIWRDNHNRDDAFQEWAQTYLDSGRWAGHDRADAVKQELLERDDQLKQAEARAQERLELQMSYERLFQQTRVELAQAEARQASLEAALTEALDELADAIPYVGEHFNKKWGYAETVARLRLVLQGASASQPVAGGGE